MEGRGSRGEHERKREISRMVGAGESESERRIRLEKLKIRTDKIDAECRKWCEGEDPRETQRRLQSAKERVRAAMEQVPWNMMDKHLHSDEARKYHEETCSFIRSQFVRVPKMATLKPSNRNTYIYASLKHRKTSSEGWSIVKLTQEKLQLNGKIKTYGLLLGVGAAVISAAVISIGRAAVGRKKDAEVIGTAT